MTPTKIYKYLIILSTCLPLVQSVPLKRYSFSLAETSNSMQSSASTINGSYIIESASHSGKYLGIHWLHGYRGVDSPSIFNVIEQEKTSGSTLLYTLQSLEKDEYLGLNAQRLFDPSQKFKQGGFKWRIVNAAGNSICFKASNGRYLKMKDASSVSVEESNDCSGDFRFKLIKAGNMRFDGDEYSFHNKQFSMFLKESNRIIYGTSELKYYKLEEKSFGMYHIKNPENNDKIYAQSSIAVAGYPPSHPQLDYQWGFVHISDETFCIINRKYEKYLGMYYNGQEHKGKLFDNCEETAAQWTVFRVRHHSDTHTLYHPEMSKYAEVSSNNKATASNTPKKIKFHKSGSNFPFNHIEDPDRDRYIYAPSDKKVYSKDHKADNGLFAVLERQDGYLCIYHKITRGFLNLKYDTSVSGYRMNVFDRKCETKHLWKFSDQVDLHEQKIILKQTHFQSYLRGHDSRIMEGHTSYIQIYQIEKSDKYQQYYIKNLAHDRYISTAINFKIEGREDKKDNRRWVLSQRYDGDYCLYNPASNIFLKISSTVRALQSTDGCGSESRWQIQKVKHRKSGVIHFRDSHSGYGPAIRDESSGNAKASVIPQISIEVEKGVEYLKSFGKYLSIDSLGFVKWVNSKNSQSRLALEIQSNGDICIYSLFAKWYIDIKDDGLGYPYLQASSTCTSDFSS